MKSVFSRNSIVLQSILVLTLCIGIFFFINPAYSKPISYPWNVTASLGAADFVGVHEGDHQTAIGRFAIGRDLVKKGPISFGLELGLQSGNQMRLQMTEEQVEALGGLLIQTTLKPTLDGLITARITPDLTVPLYIQIKGGGVYRRWQMDRDTVNDLSQLAGEVMAGVGYIITPKASLSLSYQGIFGAKPNFTVNLETGKGNVQNTPVQHAVLLGITLMI